MTSGLARSLMAVPRSRAFRYLVGLVVLLAVGRHVREVWRDIPPDRYNLAANPVSYLASILTYLAGLSCFGLFYGRILAVASTPIPYRLALRAYLISHLGKYVPGKAMVVVIRAGLSTRGSVTPAAAAFATLYETLTMMAAGGLLAAVGFCVPPVQPLYALMGFGIGIGLFVAITPMVFPRFCRVVKTPFRTVGAEAIPRVTWRLVIEGLLSASIGWVLLGASLLWIIEGVGALTVSPGGWPAIVASVAFATVAGFVIAVMPGGLGIREGLLIVTLTPIVGDGLATLSALLLRLVWVAGEVLASLVLLPFHLTGRSQEPC